MTSLEKLISEARMLGTRLRDNENFADTLISQASSLQNRLESMKQVRKLLSTGIAGNTTDEMGDGPIGM